MTGKFIKINCRKTEIEHCLVFKKNVCKTVCEK